jgi:hypothetical protein
MPDDPPTVDRLFADWPDAFTLFEPVRAFLARLDGVTMQVRKTQVSFGTARKFAWVWLPQRWIRQQPAASIVLTFALDHHIEDPRIKQAVEPRPGKWMHHSVIEDESDFDEVVQGWLVEAYELSR